RVVAIVVHVHRVQRELHMPQPRHFGYPAGVDVPGIDVERIDAAAAQGYQDVDDRIGMTKHVEVIQVRTPLDFQCRVTYGVSRPGEDFDGEDGAGEGPLREVNVEGKVFVDRRAVAARAAEVRVVAIVVIGEAGAAVQHVVDDAAVAVN